MIPKVSRGRSPVPLLRYLVDVDQERTENHHQDPHLVGGDPVVTAWYGGQVLSRADGYEVAQVLEEPHRLFGTSISGGHTWHCSLSVGAAEGRLGDERWGWIAEDFVRRMGFVEAEGKAPARWVAVHHGESAAGNDHIHVVVSLVREDGTRASVWNDFKRAQAACTWLERKYGLVVLESRLSGRGSRAPTRAEVERSKREGRAEPERVSLERLVRAHATAAGSEAEFVRRLRSGGVLVDPRFAKGRDDVVSGFSVALRPGRGRKAIWLGGGHLAKDLSLPGLRRWAGWEESPRAAVEAAGEWRRAKGRRALSRPIQTGPRRAAGVDARLWEFHAAEVGRLREGLRSVPPGDVATWARVAARSAGVFAAWSVAVEGDRPGPLAAASRSLARSAEVPAWVADGGLEPGPSLRGAARLATLVAVGGRGPVGAALLLRQLANVARAVHDMHVAVAQAQRAAEIERMARGELAAVVRRLPPLDVPAVQSVRQAAAAPGNPRRPAAVASTARRRGVAEQRRGQERGQEQGVAR